MHTVARPSPGQASALTAACPERRTPSQRSGTIISAAATPTLFQSSNGGRRRAYGSSGASAPGSTLVSSAPPTTVIEPSRTPPSSALQRRGARRASAKPAANVPRYAKARLVSSHESLGVSDHVSDAAVNAASSANASSAQMPRTRAGVPAGRGSTTAAAVRPVPPSIRPTSVQVVRSSCEPPPATNAHSTIATARPIASTMPASAGTGTEILRMRCPTPRGATYLRLPVSEDTVADAASPAQYGGEPEQDQDDDERRRQRVAADVSGERRAAGHDRLAVHLHGLRALRRRLGERLLVGRRGWGEPRGGRAVAGPASAAGRAAGAGAGPAARTRAGSAARACAVAIAAGVRRPRGLGRDRPREEIGAVGVLEAVGGRVTAGLAQLGERVVAVEDAVFDAVAPDLRRRVRGAGRGGAQQRREQGQQDGPSHRRIHASSRSRRRARATSRPPRPAGCTGPRPPARRRRGARAAGRRRAGGAARRPGHRDRPRARPARFARAGRGRRRRLLRRLSRSRELPGGRLR